MYLQKTSKNGHFFIFGMSFPKEKWYTVESIFIFKGELL